MPREFREGRGGEGRGIVPEKMRVIREDLDNNDCQVPCAQEAPGLDDSDSVHSPFIYGLLRFEHGTVLVAWLVPVGRTP